MSVYNTNTMANLRTPYYALAGESGSNWYQFSSLTGKVFLTDDTGNHVIQAVGNDLFYDNELLAKADDIQDVADWSLYPALSTILMNGQIITECSSLQVSSIAATTIATSSLDATGTIQGGTLATVPGPYSPGDVKTLTVSATSISASSNIQGGSLTTTGGIDMTNTGLLRTSNIALSAFGAPPYGNLTSPDGASLTWNGATINTGAAGSASQWANYPAVAPIQGNGQPVNNVATITTTGNVVASTAPSSAVITNNFLQNADPTNNPPLTISAANASGLYINSPSGGIASVATAGKIESTASSDVDLTTTGGDVNVNAYNQIVMNSGNDISLKADPGINPLYTAAVNLTAQNGNGGLVNITANPGQVAAFGGKINITANGGTITIPQPPPEPPLSVTVGGEVNIFANTGAGGLYTLTSAVNIAAAGVNSYAGAIPPFGSLAGYNFIYGMGGVSVCAGLPSAGFQFPGTVYIYGVGIPGVAGGVRLQSPQGIQMLSDTYIENLYPLDGNGLNIQGRSLPTGYVNITDIATLTMNSATALQTDRINSVTNLGILFQDGIQATSIRPPIAVTTGNPNLVISGYSNVLGTQNYVQIANADTIAFDPAATGSLSGVKSINGAVWPPPTGDASLWSQYPATSVTDISGFGLTNVSSLTGVSTINGLPYEVLDTGLWATFPAVQDVNMSSFSLTNVATLGVLDNFTLTSVSSIGIFSDNAGSINIATNGGGDVNIGTGNLGDINIATGGTGNEVTIAGDIVNVDATQGIRFSNRLDMSTNNIENVLGVTASVLNSAAQLTVRADNGDLNLISATSAVNITSPGVGIIINSGATGNTTVDAFNITLTPDNEIQLLGPVVVGTSAALETVTVNGAVNVTGDVVSSSGVDNYSLNTIGALVGLPTAGIPSGFRDATEFYVSFDGSDTTGLGSILSPYQTIQKAITEAELVSSAAQVCNINVASGHYNENLTFNKGYVVLTGTLQSQTGNEVCEITGSITINCTGANDVFNRQVTFQGFNITCGSGQSITNTSASSHTVSFQDCKIFVNSVCYNSTASCADARTYFTNVEISQTNAAFTGTVIATNVGLVELERVDLTVDGNAIGILIGGTSVLNRLSLSTLEITNTGTTLLPLLSFTSTSISAHSLGNVAFAFTSAVAKTATNAVYINSGVNTAIIMLNNVFTLTGTASSTNNCVGYSGVGSPTIAGVNNTSLNVNVLLPQTVSVQAGITQIAYTDINPPNMACYSTTGDQSITAVNTPQAVTFNTTQFQQGTALVASSRFYVSSQGNYQITWSLMLTQTSGTSLVTSFLKKNGTTVANTGSQTTTFSGSTSLVQVSPNFIVSLNAGDYVELWVGSNSLGTTINSTGATNGNAATPGAVFNITQIR